AVGFDALRWFEAVEDALRLPVEAVDYPGRKFTVQCADIASAAATLARSDGRMLSVLSWRGTEVTRVISRWRPEQFVEISARQVARTNPWRGLPGCIFMGNSAPGADVPVPTYFVTVSRAPEAALCARPEMFVVAEDRSHAGSSGRRRALESTAFARRDVAVALNAAPAVGRAVPPVHRRDGGTGRY